MIVNILASAAVFGSVAVSFLITLKYSGISFGKGKLSDFFTLKEQSRTGDTVTFDEIKKVFLYCVLFRIFIYLASALSIMLFTTDKAITFESFLNQWRQWDANNYLRIAAGGYTGYTENGDYTTLAFFPLYPYLMRILNFIFRNYLFSALFTSSLCYSIGCCYLYALAAADYGKSAAKKAVVYISVFPFSLFYGSMMTESTFFMTTAAAFYYIRTHNWKNAAFWGILSALSRLIGVFIVIPAALEWCESCEPFAKIREGKWHTLWKDIYSKAFFIVLIPLGTIIYLFANYRVTGNAFAFLEYQHKYWYHENCYFGKTIAQIVKNAFSSDAEPLIKSAIWLPEAFVIIFSLAALVYAARRHRSIYVIYLAAYLVVNCSVTWLISAGRYVSAAIPLFVFLGDFAERHEWSDKMITIGFSVLLGIYLTGFLFSKQIM
ncbi:MAG: glycosyltransferase family 39 protein [Clostridia bacterium]|nr:glycosyltransferase family 39 protein [Clostridia bacterium]